MFRCAVQTGRCLARAYGVPWQAGKMPQGHIGDASTNYKNKIREGHIPTITRGVDTDVRKSLNEMYHSEGDAAAVNLPGVEHPSELPADPLTRIFFQAKGDRALYQGTFNNPTSGDTDRVQIARREVPAKMWVAQVRSPIYDFCHRIREACDTRKRFVIVPASHDTKGAAQVMMNHGLIAGLRDFHNDRAFAIELKYFQNLPTITVIEPVSKDQKVEFEWSPKMMRRFSTQYGIQNRIQIFICRTHDGRIIDHLQATREHIGGRGLMMVH